MISNRNGVKKWLLMFLYFGAKKRLIIELVTLNTLKKEKKGNYDFLVHPSV